MAEARAIARYVRISPIKARWVADLVRGKPVNEAFAILAFTNKKAARLIEKVLKSAVANAAQRGDIDVDTLYIKEITVDQGPVFKRVRPMARGRAGIIRKRTSHIKIVVAEM